MAEPKIAKQIHLTVEQMQSLDHLAELAGVPLMEIIRRAIDAYIEQQEAQDEQQLRR